MEIVVRHDIYRGHHTYRAIDDNAKLFAAVAGAKNLSFSMVRRAINAGIKVRDLAEEDGEEQQEQLGRLNKKTK